MASECNQELSEQLYHVFDMLSNGNTKLQNISNNNLGDDMDQETNETNVKIQSNESSLFSTDLDLTSVATNDKSNQIYFSSVITQKIDQPIQESQNAGQVLDDGFIISDTLRDILHIKTSSTQQCNGNSKKNYFLPEEPKEKEQNIVTSRKRRQFPIDLDLSQGFNYVYEQLLKSGFGKIEIRDKIIEMVVNSPKHLDSFLRSNMQDFTKAHSHLSAINLTSIDHEMLGRKRQVLVELIHDQCDVKWSPFIFEVFVFPLTLGQCEKYILVELVYLDKYGRRRSCPLDCTQIPVYSLKMQVLKEIVLEMLRDFGVDSKIAGYSVWGTEVKDLQSILENAKLRKGHQRTLAFKENAAETINEYFLILKKNPLNLVDGIYTEVSKSLLCLDELEEILKMQNHSRPSEENNSNCSTNTGSLDFIFHQFRVIGTKMKAMEDLNVTIKRKIYQTGRDEKYAVYYTNKSNPVNLLQTVPIHSYLALAKDLSSYMVNVHELLVNPECQLQNASHHFSSILNFSLKETEENISMAKSQELIEMALEASVHWRKTLHEGIKNAEEYLKLCKYFTSCKMQPNVQSCYAKEFVSVATSAPSVMSPEEWKNIALLKAWKRFKFDSLS